MEKYEKLGLTDIAKFPVFKDKPPFSFGIKDKVAAEEIRKIYVESYKTSSFVAREATFSSDGHTLLEEDGEYFFTKQGFVSFCRTLGVPLQYLAKIDRDLSMKNLVEVLSSRMTWEMRCPFKVVYREENDKKYIVYVSPYLSPGVEVEKVIDEVEKGHESIVQARLSVGALKIDLVSPEEIGVGEEKYRYGVSVVADERYVGFSSLSDYLFRLVCSNGATIKRDIRTGRGAVSPETFLYRIHSILEMKDYYMRYLRSLDTSLKKGEVVKVAAEVVKFGEDALQQVVEIDKEKYISLRKEVLYYYKAGEEYKEISRRELFNNVTEFARDIVEYDICQRLQQTAGELLRTRG